MANRDIVIRKYMEEKEILPNYKINLIHAGNIGNPEKYKSSLHLVFGMLKYKSDEKGLKKYLEEHQSELSNIDRETYDVMSILLHMEKELNVYRQKKGERQDMCEAIKAMIEDGKEDGRIEGTIRTYKKLSVSREETFQNLKEEFSLKDEEAETYMEKYWK